MFYMLSDHFLNNINVSLQKESLSAKVILIDKEAVIADLRVCYLVLDIYDSTPRDILDENAPLRTKKMPRRLMIPWNNNNIQAAKSHRGYCERL